MGGWQTLPPELLELIYSCLTFPQGYHAAATCQWWLSAFWAAQTSLVVRAPAMAAFLSTRLYSLRHLKTLVFAEAACAAPPFLQRLAGANIHLTTLVLAHTPAVEDVALAALAALPTLTALSLVDAPRVTDAGAQCLGLLTRLQALNLSGCTHLSDLALCHLSHLPALTSLTLGCDAPGVSDVGVQYLARLSRLACLRLTVFSMTDAAVGVLAAGLPALEEVALLSPLLTGALFTRLAPCARLRALTVGTPLLRGDDLPALARLPALRALHLLSGQSLAMRDALAHVLARMPRLHALRFPVRCVDRLAHPLCAATLQATLAGAALTRLDLSGSPLLAGDDLHFLPALPHLTALALNWCPALTDAAAHHVRAVRRLHTLTTAWCPLLSDEFLAALAAGPAARTLAVLSVAMCPRIGNAGVAHLACMPCLVEVDLSGCPRVSPPALRIAGTVHTRLQWDGKGHHSPASPLPCGDAVWDG